MARVVLVGNATNGVTVIDMRAKVTKREPAVDGTLLKCPSSLELDRLVADADEIGMPPALVKAFRDLGYLVTEENRHLFSAAEIEAWRETVERYRAEDEPDDGDLGEDELVELLGVEISAVVAAR